MYTSQATCLTVAGLCACVRLSIVNHMFITVSDGRMDTIKASRLPAGSLNHVRSKICKLINNNYKFHVVCNHVVVVARQKQNR